MNRTPVKSSNIAAIGYDRDAELLEVEFKSGSVYRYTGVPWGAFSCLITSKSIGSHFHRYIRNDYPARRVPSCATCGDEREVFDGESRQPCPDCCRRPDDEIPESVPGELPG